MGYKETGMMPRRFVMEEKRTIEEILGWIEMELTNANIMTAMKMLHDNSYSDREKEYLNEFADIPFSSDEDEEDDDDPSPQA
jgi:hypothetical protein